MNARLVAVLALFAAPVFAQSQRAGLGTGSFSASLLTDGASAAGNVYFDGTKICLNAVCSTYLWRSDTNTTQLVNSGAILLTTSAATGIVANPSVNPGFSSAAASGANAFAATTNGARFDFGAGASDYASSDGTTVTFTGPLASASTVSGTQYNLSGVGSIVGGTAAGLTAGGTHVRGNVSNGAAAIAASTANNPLLTAGMDRFIHNFYNDNFSTLQAQITSDGTYLGGFGPVTKGVSKTAPTVAACSGGTAATVTSSNGTLAFVFDVGTSCAGESTAVITLPAAATGWICSCPGHTTADRMLMQRVVPAANTTTVTMQNIVISTGANGDFTDGADVACICHGN